MARSEDKPMVTLLLNVRGEVCSVYSSVDAAREKLAKFNDSPFIDGEPDRDAPYALQTWSVSS